MYYGGNTTSKCDMGSPERQFQFPEMMWQSFLETVKSLTISAIELKKN